MAERVRLFSNLNCLVLLKWTICQGWCQYSNRTAAVETTGNILEEVFSVQLPASSGVAHLWYEHDPTVIRPKDNEHCWSKPASKACSTVHYGHHYYYCIIYIMVHAPYELLSPSVPTKGSTSHAVT